MPKSSTSTWLLLLFGLLTWLSPGAWGQTIDLTPQERQWIESHPRVTLGADSSWAPYVIPGPGGRIDGIEAELLGRIGTLTGLDIRMELGKWAEILERAKRREIDGVFQATYQKEREPFFNFTDSPYSEYKFIFVRKGDLGRLTNMASLSGRRVGYMRGNAPEEKALGAYPGIIPVPSDGGPALVEALMNHQIDALIGSLDINILIQERSLVAVEMGFAVPGSELKILYALRKDWPELVPIFNKAIAAIPVHERRQIIERYVGKIRLGPEAEMNVPLTPEERAWLLQHPVLRVGIDRDWLPVEHLDEAGAWRGMSADILALVAGGLGVTLVAAPAADWPGTLQAAREGRLDLITAAAATPERSTYLNFSAPYLSFKMVIATGQDITYVNDVKELTGGKVAVVAGYAAQEFMRQSYPDIALLPVKDVRAGLEAVRTRQARAFIDSLPAINLIMNREGMTGLKIAGEAPFRYELSVGSRKDQPILASIIDKALAAVPQSKRAEITNRWNTIRDDRPVRWRDILPWVVGSLAIGVVIAIAFALWTRSLRREIVRRQAVERTLEEARRTAEAANRAKSVFLANMSHELRTPLNAIIGFSDLMWRDARAGRAPLTADQAENLDLIHRGGEHLLGLINDVLDLSKIEAGRAECQPGDCDLHALLADLRELFRERAARKRLSFQVQWAEGVPRHARTDATKLRQVLINLLGNAIKFTAEGGVLLDVADLGAVEAGHRRLRFTVTDTGPGIAPEERARLFQPFTQTLAGLSAEEGTGLGLAISRQYVRLLGGDIDVDSEPGRGSRFRFELELEALAHIEPAAETEHTVIGLKPGQPRHRVLIADDIATNRQLLVRYLAPLGFELDEAADGEAALARWREGRPDLILLDMRMPELDGYGVARRVRAEETDRHTPIVAVTASALEEQRADVLAAGCDEFLRKPFREAELFGMLRRHLGLDYVYVEGAGETATPTAAFDAGRLGALPEALLARLREALLRLDMAESTAAAQAIAAPDPELGAWLGAEIGEMRFESLLDLCEEAEALTEQTK